MSDAVTMSQAEQIAAVEREVCRLSHLEFTVSSVGVTDAVSTATANKIVKRDGSAGAAFAALVATTLTASGQITSTVVGSSSAAGIVLNSTQASIAMRDSTQSTDEQRWDSWLYSKILHHRAINGAESGAVDYMTITRGAGMVMSSIELIATAVSITGTGAVSGILTATGGARLPRSGGTAIYAVDGTVAGSEMTILNNGVAYPFGSTFYGGYFTVQETLVNGALSTFNKSAVGGVQALNFADNPSGAAYYSLTAGAAGLVSVYLEAVTGYVKVENKTGVTMRLSVLAQRTYAP